MHAQATEPTDDGICIAEGYGVEILVQRGHLIVRDGVGRDRRLRRYHRAMSRLRRVIVLGHTGYITLDAFQWLRDCRAAFLHLDSRGRLISIAAPLGPSLAGLRRAQALAASSQTGVAIARYLLAEKIAGQLAVAATLARSGRMARQIQLAHNATHDATDLRMLLGAEAEAAGAYWQAWAAIPVRFADKDQLLVPEHWRSFGGRHSPLTSSPSRAVNPANAILNYLYALLEAEATIACQAVGLDPVLGIFHTDQRNRASLALDVLEPARPVIDAYLLDVLSTEIFSRRDFSETGDGSCRLTPGVTRRLAKTVLVWRDEVAPLVDRVTAMLAASAQTTVAAPLTQAYRRAAQARPGGRSVRRPEPVSLLNSCRDCGAGLSDRRRRYCDSCRTERFQAHVDDIRANAQVLLASRRPEATQGGAAMNARAVKNTRHQRALREWTGPPADPAVFTQEIWPQIRELENVELMNATGLSAYYCSQIRLGQRVPHARHWDRLRELTRSMGQGSKP
jgi:CRISPR-associated protein Cas1